ncbi:aminotransferase class IV [Actinokineospora xionganensis]|uniref:Aminotransferase class IV n=1 Tax=Actinokineospora xionganensis TaxID=2684470 RepID=A0ABR7L525_9PSEU|nr:aminotransferase class IV [Actinokineospora xionganensis]MBC6447797.1 aminotransferase class IV [Actinokineospora xionganensis]
MSAQDDLQSMALVNYGHFTSMRVDRGRVRGLARHLERLDRDARVVFGLGIAEDLVRAEIRRAIEGRAQPVYARANVFAPKFDPRVPEAEVEPDVVVTIGELPPDDVAPLRLRTAGYQRDLPQVKHVGTFGLFYQRRIARKAGFDDALFVNSDGEVSEGSTWNVCFLDGDKVVWPSAPVLPGIAMGLIQSGMTRSGLDYEVRPVAMAELSGFRAAFATNALSPVRSISVIDDVEYEVDEKAAARLLRAHDLTPEERV